MYGGEVAAGVRDACRATCRAIKKRGGRGPAFMHSAERCSCPADIQPEGLMLNMG